MKFHQSLTLCGLVLALLSTSACSKLFGGVRRDMDDQQAAPQYTSGGQWPEHGFLSEDMPEGGDPRYNAVGHSERGPASEGGAGTPTTWVSQDQATANQRDTMRGVDENGNPPSFSNSPNMGPPTRRMYKNGNRATRADFVDDSQNEGSLWASDGQTNYFFTKNRVRGVGDILTIKMENAFVQDVGSEIKRTLTSSEKDAEIQAAQDRMSGGTNAAAAPAAGGTPGTPAAAPSGGPAPASVASGGGTGGFATDKDIDVTKSIDAKEGDPVMAEIVERYPNGNYKVRGTKKVIYKNGTPRLLTLVGIARSADIGEDDVINSGKLYEYRLEAYR